MFDRYRRAAGSASQHRVRRHAARTGILALVVATLGLLAALPGHAQTSGRRVDATPFCGDEGVWIQILGGGGMELDDGRTPASYVIFLDNQARLLVDPASGASSLFGQAGGRVNDLDAIVLSTARAERMLDLPAFLIGARAAERNRLLPILGPDGGAGQPDTVTAVERLIGPEGAYPELAGFLPPQAVGRFRASPRNVPATGQRRWADFGNDQLQLSAVPAYHGGVPALIWKAEIAGKTIVFAGDTNNSKNNLAQFAKGADALVIHHSIPENTRGTLTDFHMAPGQIGQIAASAGVRMVILGHRMNRTLGRESLSTAALQEHYKGSLIFADDLECWGL
jgi:ribonuclease BN (tRNA processing enzyme)